MVSNNTSIIDPEPILIKRLRRGESADDFDGTAISSSFKVSLRVLKDTLSRRKADRANVEIAKTNISITKLNCR
jgi:hypothetical protein